jgi:hypothetical protein
MSTRSVRQNYLAILVAAIAYFLLEAVWFTLFMDRWLEGIGRTRQWLMGTGMNPAFQYGTAFICAMLIATALSCVTQLTGEQTAIRGAQCGALLWLGFVATTWASEYIFEVRTFMTFFINTGITLLGMVLMGLIVGGWRAKVKV